VVLRIKDLCDIIEKKAPIYLKEEWDNVGLMVGDAAIEITSILVALDCTLEVIEEAIEKDCNLILTHHPLIFHSLNSVTNQDLLGSKIYKLIDNNIAVYSAHTNLDRVKGGLNDILCNILGLNNYIEMSLVEEDRGIGRLVQLLKGTTMENLMEHITKKLDLGLIRYTGDKSRLISKIAIINGSGSDYFNTFYKLGAECIITGDTKHHQVLDYMELNLSTIDIGHFDSEWLPFKVFCEELKEELKDKNMIFSEKSFTPYKVFKNI